MLGQSPPTTSGIVVISGSNNFGPGSDFPVFSSISIKYSIDDFIFTSPIGLSSSELANEVIGVPPSLVITDFVSEETTLGPLMGLSSSVSADLLVFPSTLVISDMSIDEDFAQTNLMFVSDPQNIKTTSTPVTTSGIVILDLFPGAGVVFIPFVPPIFINQRIFPVIFSGPGERLFPEENKRIYPVLPQFSIITPGD